MLYFPIVLTLPPESFPIWGGQEFEFFKPVSILQDAAISVGVISILLFHRYIIQSDKKSNETSKWRKFDGRKWTIGTLNTSYLIIVLLEYE